MYRLLLYAYHSIFKVNIIDILPEILKDKIKKSSNFYQFSGTDRKRRLKLPRGFYPG